MHHQLDLILCPKILLVVGVLVTLIFISSRIVERYSTGSLITALLLMVYLWISIGRAVHTGGLDTAEMLVFVPVIPIVFALVYTCLAFHDKSAFGGDGISDRSSVPRTWVDTLFYAIVNMTTISYTRIWPVSQYARWIVIAQYILCVGFGLAMILRHY